MKKYGAIVCSDCEVEMIKKQEKFICPECGKEREVKKMKEEKNND